MCGVPGRSLVFPAPRASGRGSPGRLLPTLAMRPGFTPTFDGSGDAAALRQGLTPTFDGFGQPEAAGPRRREGAASITPGRPVACARPPGAAPAIPGGSWPKPSKFGVGGTSRQHPGPKPSKVGTDAKQIQPVDAQPATPQVANLTTHIEGAPLVTGSAPCSHDSKPSVSQSELSLTTLRLG